MALSKARVRKVDVVKEELWKLVEKESGARRKGKRDGKRRESRKGRERKQRGRN